MISSEELLLSKMQIKEKQSLMVEKNIKIDISKLNIQGLKDLYPAVNNTLLCVDAQSNPGRVLHFKVDGTLLGELLLKEPEYIVFMMAENVANVFQYSPKKPASLLVQWNLDTHETISVNYNRQILPSVKIFTFSETQTFCICQYDFNTEVITQQKNPNFRQIEAGTYHTKFKMTYYKYPIKKQHPKPYIVFKSHTNPKQYGFHQQIIKLNDHSMVGSISSKMDETDSTLLKTFDFRNNPMGTQTNYKFQVQINYRKEIFQIWITDMWEIKPQFFYLKCQLRTDRAKVQKMSQKSIKSCIDIDYTQQCIHLTWAYKNQNTIKFSKFKTPILNQIQFLDGFNAKQRVKSLYHRAASKQKGIKLDQIPFNQPFIKSINSLPVYYVNNSTEEVVAVDRDYCEWMASYPGYHPRMVVYFRQLLSAKSQEKPLEVVIQKMWQNMSFKEVAAFWMTQLIDSCDNQLLKKVYNLVDESAYNKPQADWHFVEMNKIIRENHEPKSVMYIR